MFRLTIQFSKTKRCNCISRPVEASAESLLPILTWSLARAACADFRGADHFRCLALTCQAPFFDSLAVQASAAPPLRCVEWAASYAPFISTSTSFLQRRNFYFRASFPGTAFSGRTLTLFPGCCQPLFFCPLAFGLGVREPALGTRSKEGAAPTILVPDHARSIFTIFAIFFRSPRRCRACGQGISAR